MTRNVRWLGEATPDQILKYKSILLVWSKSSGVSSPLTSPPYGQGSGDMSSVWNCLRDGVMLVAFGKWWNGMGKLPMVGAGKGSEGYFPTTGPCKCAATVEPLKGDSCIYVADLDAKYMAALDTWAGTAPGGWTACPPGQVYDLVKKQCVAAPAPSPAAPAAPAPGTPVVPLTCMQQCEKDHGTGNTAYLTCIAACAAKAAQTPAAPAPAEPRKPPARTPSAPSAGVSAESSPNTGLLVAGGLALAGLVGWLVWSGSKKGTGIAENPRGADALDRAVLAHARSKHGTLASGMRVGKYTITKVGTHTVQYDNGAWHGSVQIPFIDPDTGEALPSLERAQREFEPNPAPSRNVYWKDIKSTDRVTLEGKPGTRYYVVRRADGTKATAYWGGNEARLAQRFLDERSK